MDMRNEASRTASHDSARAHAHKASAELLTFRLGGEEYGIDILRVQEIRSCEEPTRIAMSTNVSTSFITGSTAAHTHPLSLALNGIHDV